MHAPKIINAEKVKRKPSIVSLGVTVLGFDECDSMVAPSIGKLVGMGDEGRYPFVVEHDGNSGTPYDSIIVNPTEADVQFVRSLYLTRWMDAWKTLEQQFTAISATLD